MTSTGIVLSPTCTLLMAAKAIARRPSSVVSSGLSNMIRVSFVFAFALGEVVAFILYRAFGRGGSLVAGLDTHGLKLRHGRSGSK